MVTTGNLTIGPPDGPAVPAAETAAIRAVLGDQPMTADFCMYTLTPDDHLLLGPLPENDNVFAGALAGHGFKFAPVPGEILADLIEGNSPATDVSFFAPGRRGKLSAFGRQTPSLR